MKKKIKIGFVVLVFIVVSVCGMSVYRHFTAPKKERRSEEVRKERFHCSQRKIFWYSTEQP